MNPADSTECVNLLAQMFPVSGLTDAEIDLFRSESASFDRDSLVDAIRMHRIKCAFNRPRFDAIFAIAREGMRNKPGARRPESQYRTALCRSMAALNPALRGRPEAELILRNYRYFMRFKTKNHETGATDFYDIGDDIPQSRLERLSRECADDLVQAGWETGPAQNAAQCIGWDEFAWPEALRDVQSGATPRTPVDQLAEAMG